MAILFESDRALLLRDLAYVRRRLGDAGVSEATRRRLVTEMRGIERELGVAPTKAAYAAARVKE